MSVDGKICVVTGANSGVGKAMASALAARGATVVMVARDPARGAAALEELQRTARGPVSLELADLSLLRDVRALAERLRERFPKVHVLMNNAGIFLAKRRLTEEGHEFSMVVNHLAPFLLVNALRDRLAAAGGARVVTTGSMAYTTAKLDVDDLSMEKGWSALRQYANAKLAALLTTREVARRFASEGVIANCYHPGGVRSGMAQDEPSFMGTMMRVMGPFLRSPERGADTGLWLATDESLRASGAFFVDRKQRALRGAASDQALAERLWDVSATLTGAR